MRFQPCIPGQEVAKHRNNGIISRAPAKGQILILISTLRHESGTKKAFLDLLHMDMRLQQASYCNVTVKSPSMTA